MHVIESRNVNSAYQRGLRFLLSKGEEEQSRAGDVLVAPTPVINVYHKPRERVLFDVDRDANPFFHLLEAVWMLAGENDARKLDRFVGDFSSRFAEDNGLAHGAYGYRWRRHFVNDRFDPLSRLDQIMEAGGLLRENPRSRQVVLAMWDPTEDLGAKKRDIPCNDLVMFRAVPNSTVGLPLALNMSIVARSHDAVWGAYGANIVHMSVMHEAVAALADMEVGTYTHFSNNFHVYKNVLPKLGEFITEEEQAVDPYESGAAKPQRIAESSYDAAILLRESEQLFQQLGTDPLVSPFEIPSKVFQNSWLRDTVVPMVVAHTCYKQGDFEAAERIVNEVASSDWRIAGSMWLQRRHERMKQKGYVD